MRLSPQHFLQKLAKIENKKRWRENFENKEEEVSQGVIRGSLGFLKRLMGLFLTLFLFLTGSSGAKFKIPALDCNKSGFSWN